MNSMDEWHPVLFPVPQTQRAAAWLPSFQHVVPFTWNALPPLSLLTRLTPAFL